MVYFSDCWLISLLLLVEDCSNAQHANIQQRITIYRSIQLHLGFVLSSFPVHKHIVSCNCIQMLSDLGYSVKD